MKDFQYKVAQWCNKTFSTKIANNKDLRSKRFIEEALELVQSLGLTKEEVQYQLNRVYNRSIGETYQEVGGVMITLAQLCNVDVQDMLDCGIIELERISNDKVVQKIRLKEQSKIYDEANHIEQFNTWQKLINYHSAKYAKYGADMIDTNLANNKRITYNPVTKLYDDFPMSIKDAINSRRFTDFSTQLINIKELKIGDLVQSPSGYVTNIIAYDTDINKFFVYISGAKCYIDTKDYYKIIIDYNKYHKSNVVSDMGNSSTGKFTQSDTIDTDYSGEMYNIPY